MTFEFQLSDREFARAWIAEYFRRSGIGRLRVIAGPAMVFIGWRMYAGAHEGVGRGIAIAAILFGLWHVARPWVLAWMLVRRRRRSGAAGRAMRVTVDPGLGITVGDGGGRETRFGWDQVTRAGRGSDYVWFELARGVRGTIPSRAIPDEAALVEVFRSRSKWS